MEEELRALLLADDAVKASVEDRVNFTTHPGDKPFPAIVLSTMDGGSEYTFSGESSLKKSRVQVDCYALTYKSVKILSRSVLKLLGGFQSGSFQGVFHDSTREGREVATTLADRPYRISMDFMVHYNS